MFQMVVIAELAGNRMRPLSSTRDSLCSEDQDTKGYLGIHFPSVLPPEDWSTYIRHAMANGGQIHSQPSSGGSVLE